MLCQVCKKREALVHLGDGTPGATRWRKHFCSECVDRHYARTPGMNSARDLIQLSNFYRTKLYDALEKEHPEAFDNSTTEACIKGSNLMRRFLRKRLAKDNVKLNRDGFEMLCHDFFTTHHFYDRVAKRKGRSA